MSGIKIIKVSQQSPCNSGKLELRAAWWVGLGGQQNARCVTPPVRGQDKVPGGACLGAGQRSPDGSDPGPRGTKDGVVLTRVGDPAVCSLHRLLAKPCSCLMYIVFYFTILKGFKNTENRGKNTTSFQIKLGLKETDNPFNKTELFLKPFATLIGEIRYLIALLYVISR